MVRVRPQQIRSCCPIRRSAHIDVTVRRAAVVVTMALAAIALLAPPGTAQSDAAPSEAPVYVVPIAGPIDLGWPRT